MNEITSLADIQINGVSLPPFKETVITESEHYTVVKLEIPMFGEITPLNPGMRIFDLIQDANVNLLAVFVDGYTDASPIYDGAPAIVTEDSAFIMDSGFVLTGRSICAKFLNATHEMLLVNFSEITRRTFTILMGRETAEGNIHH